MTETIVNMSRRKALDHLPIAIIRHLAKVQIFQGIIQLLWMLSKFYLGFIWILSGFYLNFIWVLSGFYLGFIKSNEVLCKRFHELRTQRNQDMIAWGSPTSAFFSLVKEQNFHQEVRDLGCLLHT